MYGNNNEQYRPEENQVSPIPVYPPVMPADPEVDACVDSAFGKALASAIMCEFPIASIIAIVMGSTSLNLVEQAKFMAAQRGVKPSGKIVAATILGKIGKIAGIVMTVFWAIYFFIILVAFMNI